MDAYELDDAARDLCRNRNQDPHEMVLAPAQGSDTVSLSIYHTRPRWMNARDEIIAHQQVASLATGKEV